MRPQRERKAPERFGLFASKRTAEELEEEGEEEMEVQAAPRRRRARRQRSEELEEEEERPRPAARKRKGRGKDKRESDSEGESDSDSGDEEEEEAEEQPAGARRKAGGNKRARTAAAGAPAPLWVLQPPAEPRSRADMLSLLFACPALLDQLLEPDGLRTVSLVARDVASLATALCGGVADMDGVWHQLARRCDPSFGAGGAATSAQALEVVRRGVAADPARRERCNKSTAQGSYRLTEKDMAGLQYTTRPNPVFWDAPPVKMYNKLEVLALAHRKHGSMTGLQAARAQAQAKSEKAKATRGQHAEQRKEELAAALEEQGLPGLTSRKYRKHKDVQAYIKRGAGGTATSVAASLKAQDEEEKRRAQREKQLRQRLTQEGMQGQVYSLEAQAFIAGTSKQRLGAVVAALKKVHEAAAAKAARRASIRARFEAEGLQEYVGQGLGGYYYRRPSATGIDEYIESGEGSEEAVVAAARGLRDKEEAQVARQARMMQLLAAEGLERHRYLAAVSNYIQSGEGSEEGALAAAREVHQAQEQRQLRRQRMNELAAAEGVAGLVHMGAICDYVDTGKGSEQEALAAARQQHLQRQQQDQRRVRMRQLIKEEGIDYVSVQYLDSLLEFIETGEGSEEEVLEEVKQTYQPAHNRRQRMTALLAAEGMDYDAMRYHVEGLFAYVSRGAGSEEAVLAAARRTKQDDEDRLQRRTRVTELLAAQGLGGLEQWEHRCYEVTKYLRYSEGGAEEAVAAAKKIHDAAAARQAARAAALAAVQAAVAVAAGGQE